MDRFALFFAISLFWGALLGESLQEGDVLLKISSAINDSEDGN